MRRPLLIKALCIQVESFFVLCTYREFASMWPTPVCQGDPSILSGSKVKPGDDFASNPKDSRVAQEIAKVNNNLASYLHVYLSSAGVL